MTAENMMTETISNVLVFRTTILTDPEYEQLEKILNTNKEILKWTLDLQDCDKVLRVVSHNLCADDIVGVLDKAGLFCEELPD